MNRGLVLQDDMIRATKKQEKGVRVAKKPWVAQKILQLTNE